MSRMSSVTRFSKETYKCPKCDKEFENDMVCDTWKCPDCAGYIHVYGMDTEIGLRRVVIRKRGDEVEEGDLVAMPDQPAMFEKGWRVLGIINVGEVVRLGLKEFGTYKVKKDQPVNCILGSW